MTYKSQVYKKNIHSKPINDNDKSSSTWMN